MELLCDSSGPGDIGLVVVDSVVIAYFELAFMDSVMSLISDPLNKAESSSPVKFWP